MISNLQYSPSSATQGQGGGAVTVTGAYDFGDAGGDVVSSTFIPYDSQGKAGTPITSTISNVAGVKAGTIYFYYSADTTVKGVFTGKLYVTVSTGATSNTLTGTFSVL